ncbi:MAG: 1-deoxy-D-xylulose-5-phosphate reductoisomerase [Oscillospiraceae bacterium]|nr:1-deoxy-D-xylulose-5-phosphate reductoisomerase [Oscillospiraceae bacterium]
MVNEISLLGATGSIGQQVLSVAKAHNIRVKALTAAKNKELLAKMAKEFLPFVVCISDESLYKELKSDLFGLPVKVLCGSEGLSEIAALKVDMTVNALVGMAGLNPTLEAINAGNNIALANKETLVAAGEIVMRAAMEKDIAILPIDSEHSAIFQCLLGGRSAKKIILTASGGPFFGYTTDMLKSVSREQALKHPNWEMGQKITIDSATMMNKGLELIEAMWLFGVDSSQIEIVIHRQSIVHSAVEYIDGAIIAQLGVPDMRVPIQYALSYPDRFVCEAKALSLTEIGTLTFEPPDEDTFTCLKSARKAAAFGGNAGCIINSANEEAVALFLSEKIKFLEIPTLIEGALEDIPKIKNPTLEQIFETQAATREYIKERTELKI